MCKPEQGFYGDNEAATLASIETDKKGKTMSEEVKIETGVTPPEKGRKKSRAREKASGKTKAANPAASLIGALKFISVAQRKAGQANLQFCLISSGWVVASNEILTVAHPVQEAMEVKPHTLQFLEALGQSKDDLSITQLNENTLCVTSGHLRALVPCLGPESNLYVPPPDPVSIAVSDRLKQAIETVSGIISENAEKAVLAAFLLGSDKAPTCVGFNGTVLLEAYHGFNLPAMLVPKIAGIAVAKSPYELKGLGFSNSSVTFHFENGAFIKTQVYSEPYFDYLQKFDSLKIPSFYKAPEDLFKAIEILSPFGQGIVNFETDKLTCKSGENISSYKMDLFLEKASFDIKDIESVKAHFANIGFDKEKEICYFMSDTTRGLIKMIPSENA